MDENKAVLRRLDPIQATLALAFEPQLATARDQLRSDDVSAAILDETKEWIGSTELQKKVSKTTGKVDRVVRERLPGLVERRVLEVRGTEMRKKFRRTGLI
jgi:hypothetical protein